MSKTKFPLFMKKIKKEKRQQLETSCGYIQANWEKHNNNWWNTHKITRKMQRCEDLRYKNKIWVSNSYQELVLMKLQKYAQEKSWEITETMIIRLQRVTFALFYQTQRKTATLKPQVDTYRQTRKMAYRNWWTPQINFKKGAMLWRSNIQETRLRFPTHTKN